VKKQMNLSEGNLCKTESVNLQQYLFMKCIDNICLSNVYTTSVYQMYIQYLFIKCIDNICLSNVLTTSVYEMYIQYLFIKCIDNICLSNVYTTSVYEMYIQYLFMKCIYYHSKLKIKELPLFHYDVMVCLRE